MKAKITLLIILFLLFIIFIFQFKEIKRLNKNIEEKETLLLSIQKNNEVNIFDLQNRNQELITRNEELKVLFNESEEISSNVKQTNKNDCLNQSVNLDIVKLLQKAGI